MKLNCFNTNNIDVSTSPNAGTRHSYLHNSQQQPFVSPDFTSSLQELNRACNAHRKNHQPLAELMQSMADFDRSQGSARITALFKMWEANRKCIACPPAKASTALTEALHQFNSKATNAVMGQKSMGADPWARHQSFQALEDCRAAVAKSLIEPPYTQSIRVGPFDVQLYIDSKLSPQISEAAQSDIRKAFEEISRWPEARLISRNMSVVMSDSPSPLFRTQAFAGTTPCVCLGKNFFAPPNPRIPADLEGQAGALIRGGIGVSGPRGVADILVDEQRLTGDAANHLKREVVVLHELAHLIHAGTDPLNFLEMKEGRSADCCPIRDAELVSHYATSNGLEFVAEALVSKRHGQVLPPQVQHTLNRFLRQ